MATWMKNTAEYIREHTSDRYRDSDEFRANIFDKLDEYEDKLGEDEAKFLANLLNLYQFESEFRNVYHDLVEERIARRKEAARKSSRRDRDDGRRERSRSYSRR